MYKYHRRTGARLPDLPESHPDFVAAWAKEEGNKSRPIRAPAGSLAALIELFLSSGPGWSTWSPSYRKMIRRHLDGIVETGGHARALDVRPHHIQQNINALPGNTANERRKAWMALMKWATETGHIPTDPAKGTRGRQIRTEGHKPWPADLIAAFRDAHPIGSEIRLGFETVYWTGARCVDARLLGDRSVDRGFISYTQRKTGGPALVPLEDLPAVFEPLRPDLIALKACLAAAGPRMVWTYTAQRKPRSEKGFSNWISKAAGPGYSAHGLRKNRLMALAECGGSSIQLQAWCGHQSLSEVETYIREASRRAALLGNVK
ncbi:MAG: tyrosine-type recombinase/integrase [Pseudomonadota bacterium]